MKQEKKYVFRSADFYELLEEGGQNFTCALTGRVLEPPTTDICHKLPIGKGGRHSKENLHLIHSDVVKLARVNSTEEIVEIAAEIIKYIGKDYGYSIRNYTK